MAEKCRSDISSSTWCAPVTPSKMGRDPRMAEECRAGIRSNRWCASVMSEELGRDSRMAEECRVGVAEMKVVIERTGGLVVLAESFGRSVFKDSFRRVFKKGEESLGLSHNGTLEINCREHNDWTGEHKDDMFLGNIKMHVDYCMHRVNLLRHFGIKLILVFDGGQGRKILHVLLSMKNLETHQQLMNVIKKTIDISPTIAYELIQVLKQENISYVVAPYEADAKMTFLALRKHVDAVITDDSNLIPFGCPRVSSKFL
ncbi:hypothetical protein LXL04_017852 [Taraxacum kok-saghyz]